MQGFFETLFSLQALTYPCSEASGIFPGLWENSEVSEVKGSLELGLSKSKVEILAALQVGATEIQSMFLKVVFFLSVTTLIMSCFFSCLTCFKVLR